jgi:YaaC-like Protein
VSVYHSPNPRDDSLQIYDLFAGALCAPRVPNKITYSVVNDLLPQIVIGHRLWASAANSKERFLRVQRIRIRHAPKSKVVWLTLDFQRSDLKECGINHTQLRSLTGLSTEFVEVKPRLSGDAQKNCRLELRTPILYTRWPSDVLSKLCTLLRPYLWTIVRSVPPYRRFYVYAPPPNSRVIHPLLSVYAVIFYLGSVTRYRPHHFDKIANNEYGNLIHEIIDNQMLQFLYQLASEFAKREVSSPAVL